MMDGLRALVAEGEVEDGGESGIEFVKAEEFEYTDPVDGSFSGKQGMVLRFKTVQGDARAVFRLSGTGSAGATIRLYLEQFDGENIDGSAKERLEGLGREAVRIAKLQELTGRERPTVVT